MKAVLSKSPARRQHFKESCKLPFPPDVIEIRWNSWFRAAFYYAENFSPIKSFVNELETDSKKVTQLKQTINDANLEQSLFTLHGYKFLTDAITKLESQGMTVEQQLAVVSSVKSKLSGDELEKLNKVLSKNPDLNFFRDLPVDYKIKANFAPMTSVDVERSLSVFKYILSDRRHSLTESNLAMLNVIQYNNFINDDNDED